MFVCVPETSAKIGWKTVTALAASVPEGHSWRRSAETSPQKLLSVLVKVIRNAEPEYLHRSGVGLLWLPNLRCLAFQNHLASSESGSSGGSLAFVTSEYLSAFLND